MVKFWTQIDYDRKKNGEILNSDWSRPKKMVKFGNHGSMKYRNLDMQTYISFI